jgi:YVTN family beta-propeller protein
MFNSSAVVTNNFLIGVRMRFRRVGRLAAMVLPIVLWMACGQVYRPVVLPCSVGGLPGCPVETPPTPSNFHAVFGISANVPDSPGGALQINVSGDSIIAATPSSDSSAPNLGDNPTHAAISSNDSKVFVAGAGSISGQPDSVAYFTPVFQFNSASGFSNVGSISLPSQSASVLSISEAGNVVTVTVAPGLTSAAGYAISIVGTLPATAGYNGTFPISTITSTPTQATITFNSAITGLPPCSPTPPNPPCPTTATAAIPFQPVFLNSIESTAMYVANYNTNTISAINSTLNVVSNSAAVGMNPVSLAEAKSQNGYKVYVANQGVSQATSSISSVYSVTSGNSITLTPTTVTGFTGTNPVWAVARGDGQRVYVVTQGDGQLVTIDTATDTVIGSASVGAGANFIYFDPNLNRLYVTNPTTSTVYVFSDTGGTDDTPVQLAMLSLAGTSLCTTPTTCSTVTLTPLSVTALQDGSRFYVASYLTASACSDQFIGTSSACVVPALTVFNANNFTLEYSTASTLTLLTSPPFSANPSTNAYQYAVPPVAACGPTVPPPPTTLYAPGSTRFRVFTVASADSSRVYVSMCDAGAIAVIDTTDSNNNETGSTGTPADTLVTDLPAAFSAGAIQSNGLPANQNPIFLVTGQ